VTVGIPALTACGSVPPRSRPTSGTSHPAPTGTTSLSPSSRPPLPAEVVSGPRDKPNVALTFHGQGDAAVIRRLLAELEQGGARVTVLAVGSWLRTQPDMAKRILDGGHELGNHTQNHLDIASMDASHAYAEINTCAQLLAKLTGSIGVWFRPSQTQHSTPNIQAQAARVGYPTCLSYDVDSLDYTDPAPAAVTNNTLRQVRAGSIVSMHFGHAATVSAMPAILDGLRKKGLTAVTMSELIS